MHIRNYFWDKSQVLENQSVVKRNVFFQIFAGGKKSLFGKAVLLQRMSECLKELSNTWNRYARPGTRHMMTRTSSLCLTKAARAFRIAIHILFREKRDIRSSIHYAPPWRSILFSSCPFATKVSWLGYHETCAWRGIRVLRIHLFSNMFHLNCAF